MEVAALSAMHPLLAALQNQPVHDAVEGETVIEQGARTGRLYVLIEGTVEVTKDGVNVTKTNEPGAVFGDLALLLGVPHTAAVRALTPCRFFVVAEGRQLLEEETEVTLHLCTLLARRLDAVNKYLVNLKQQFAGHDHLGMVDGMLDMLMHRQPRERVAPPRSTLRDPEVLD
jgi:CRP/FNR family transcriptional regulator, cyclic AMP receptor protein